MNTRHFIQFIAFFVLLYCSMSSSAAEVGGEHLLYPDLVHRFYAATNQRLYWVGSGPSAAGMRLMLLHKLDSAASIGSNKSRYGYEPLKTQNEKLEKHTLDSAGMLQLDMRLTDAAIAYCKDLYQGLGIAEWIKYDEWSPRYEARDDSYLLKQLTIVKSPGDFATLLNILEPAGAGYAVCKTELSTLRSDTNTFKAAQIAVTMNFYRWMHHFGFERFIVVNIPSATLRYFENDSEKLFSKMIVGKPSRRTPRFNASCRQVILYPFWNVPTDIAQKELVPKYKKNRALIDRENMQVLDAKGNVLDPGSINWSGFSRNYFPYRLRQSTGCDNSLGVIKFDLTSPFGVYLHDTNEKGMFKSKNRFRSHGCMRVEKAIELGNLLLDNKLDTAFLAACIRDEKPVTMPLQKPVPVFVVYLTADCNDTTVTYYNDVYHLFLTTKN